MLVNQSLVAVISLPAGCFNPYSGVKTSILILDKSLAKQADSVAFFKIENDGYGLGAQRRAVANSDLPQVKRELDEYLSALRQRRSVDELSPTCGLIVTKEKLAANGEFNLSGERYRDGIATNHSFPLVSLGEVDLFRVESGGTPKSDIAEYWNGGIAWATLVDLPSTDFISQITATQRTISSKGLKESSAKIVPANSVIVSTRATIGRIAINRIPIATNQGFKNVVIEDLTRAVPEYVALALTRLVPTMQAWATGGTFAEISKSKFCELEIPLPPLEVQKEIVAEIEGYQKVIDGARAVLDHYRPHIPIHPDWPLVTIGDLTEINNGYVLTEFSDERNVACIKVSDMNLEENKPDIVTSSHWLDRTDKRLVPVDSVVFPKRGAAIATNKKRFTKIPCLVDNNCMALTVKARMELLPRYLFNFLVGFDLSTISNSAGIALINNGDIQGVKIPLPPLATQQAIVAEIEAEQALVNGNRELITRFEQKIQTTLARVWGES